MMIGAILVQNTSWTNVDKAMEKLKPYLDANTIQSMPTEKLAELIRSSGFFNMKAKRVKAFVEWFLKHDCNVEELKKWPLNNLRNELLSIHGIGRETADDMLLYAFDKPVFIVDAYARRIFYRIGFDMPTSYDSFRLMVEAELPESVYMFNEYHAVLVEHAKVHCRKKPICSGCPLITICSRRIN
ncbi:endonuclease [Aciduricibacillus chroicocephali]|uniref:Endonuclease n=1 Tax=Aciduricibacillus chroicocephali TaxID=3054939 RepID=A0ABY9KVQ4_9BACI|nr:endonuclease [Bacillaceae bacterium 44XB]